MSVQFTAGNLRPCFGLYFNPLVPFVYTLDNTVGKYKY